MPVTDLAPPSRVAGPGPAEEMEINSAFSTKIREGAEELGAAVRPAEGESRRHILLPRRRGVEPIVRLPVGSRISTASGFSFRAALMRA